MRRIKPKYAVIIAVILVATAAAASDWKTAKYAGAFMETGVGARALGMGGAYSAIADDITALYWNPAGLASMQNLQVHGMHSERFSGIVNWDFIGIGLPFSRDMAAAFGFFRLGVEDIPLTALRDPSRALGEIYIDEDGRRVRNDPYAAEFLSDTEMAFVFSFAKKSERFQYGANIRIIRKEAGGEDAWGIGFDFGLNARIVGKLLLSAVLMDATSTLIAWAGDRRELILPHIKIGLCRPLVISTFNIIPVLDLDIHFENRGNAAQIHWGRYSLDVHAGIECAYKDRFALRTGIDAGQFTAGAGIRLSAFNIDYGFSRHNDLGNTNRVSLTFNLDRQRISSL